MTKRDRLWEILGPIFGIVAMILLFLGLADNVIRGCLACEVSVNSSPAALSRAFAETKYNTELAAYLLLLGTFFFLGFLGYLRRELQTAEGERGWLTSVAYGGGLVMGATVLIQMTLDLASTGIGNNPEIARTLFALLFNIAFVSAAPMAALVAATTVIILRHRWLPWPIGLLGIPVVVLALTPYIPGLGAGVAIMWILLLAVFMLWRSVRGLSQAGSSG